MAQKSQVNPVDHLFPNIFQSFSIFRGFMLLVRVRADQHWKDEDGTAVLTEDNLRTIFRHGFYSEVVRMLRFQGILTKVGEDKYVVHPLVRKAVEDQSTRLTYQFYDDLFVRQSYFFGDIVGKADVSSIKALTGETTFYAAMITEQKNWSEFMNYQSSNFIPQFTDLIKFHEGATLLDVACNHGENVCLYYMKKEPTLQVTLVDLPVKRQSATEFVASKGYSDSVKFHEDDVDVFACDKEPFGQFDYVTCTHFCTMFNTEELVRLFTTFFKNLKPGGVFGMVHKVYDGEPEWSNETAYSSSIATLLFFTSTMGKGSLNSVEWHKNALLGVGFESVDVHRVEALSQIDNEPWAYVEFAFLAHKAK